MPSVENSAVNFSGWLVSHAVTCGGRHSPVRTCFGSGHHVWSLSSFDGMEPSAPHPRRSNRARAVGMVLCAALEKLRRPGAVGRVAAGICRSRRAGHLSHLRIADSSSSTAGWENLSGAALCTPDLNLVGSGRHGPSLLD